MKLKKRKRIIRISKFGLVCMSLIVLLSIVGMGYGSYQNGAQIETVISTGHIDTVFIDCKEDDKPKDKKVDPKDPNKKAKVDIKFDTENPKKVAINIVNAHPGESITIECDIANQGSIPVVCKIEPESQDDDKKGEIATFKITDDNGEDLDGQVIKSKKDMKAKISIAIDDRKGKREDISGGMEGSGDDLNTDKAERQDYTLNLAFEQYNLLDKQ